MSAKVSTNCLILYCIFRVIVFGSKFYFKHKNKKKRNKTDLNLCIVCSVETLFIRYVNRVSRIVYRVSCIR